MLFAMGNSAAVPGNTNGNIPDKRWTVGAWEESQLTMRVERSSTWFK